MTTFNQNIHALNNAVVDLVGSGAPVYTQGIDALNRIADELGGTGGHRRSIDALNEISGIVGGATGFTQNIQALNAILGALGQSSVFTQNIGAFNLLAEIGFAVGPGGEAVVFSNALTGVPNQGWQGYTLVQLISAANLDAASGTQIRVTLAFSEPPLFGLPSSSTFEGWIGQKAAAGDAYDFTGTQVELLWAGVSPSAPADGVTLTYVSDWVTLGEAYDETKDYLVAIQLVGASNIIVKSAAITGNNEYSKIFSDPSETNKSGYSLDAANLSLLVSQIEIR